MTQLGNGFDAFWATLLVTLRGGGVLPQIHVAYYPRFIMLQKALR